MDFLAAYQAYATQYQNKLEVIDGMLWDTTPFVSAAINNITFFDKVNASLDLGNMTNPNQLPNPSAFLIRAVSFYVKQRPRSVARAAAGSVTTGAFSNIQLLINTGTLIFSIGAKRYVLEPLWKLPSGAGPYGSIGLDGNTADPGIVIDYATNGLPSMANVHTLSTPLFLAPLINFSCLATWPAAITLAGGNTNVTVALLGDSIRPVQ